MSTTVPGRVLRRLAVATAACLSVLLPIAATAQAAWEAAAQSGSGELLLYTLMRERPAGFEEPAVALARRLALTERSVRVAEIAHTSLRFSPALAYDDNINAGVPGRSILVGSYEFVIDEESRAKEGIVVGADGGAGIALALGAGARMTADLGLSWRYAPAHDLMWQAAQAELCTTRPYADWRWIEGCVSLRGTERALSTTFTRRLAFANRRVVSSGWGDHELTLGAFFEDSEGVEQAGASLCLLTARPGFGLVGFELVAGERVRGRSAVTAAASLWGARDIFGAPGTLVLSVREESGSRFFDRTREDRVWNLSVARDIGDRLTATLGLTARNSNVAVYDDHAVTFALQFRGWRK